MSTASKVTFATTCVFAAGAFVFINYSQQTERAAMRVGPIRDAERMQARELTKKQLVNDLEHKEQIELRERLIKIQPLSGEIIRGEEPGNALK